MSLKNSLKEYGRKGLDYLVRDAYRTVDDAKNAGKYAIHKVLPVALAGAMLATSMGCPWQKSKDNDTSSGSSGTPSYNYVVQAKDFDGNPIQGAQVSLYDSSVYNVDDGTGDMDLPPKTSGYYTTNANGEANLTLDDREHHIVVKANGVQTERAFNANVSGSSNITIECCPGNDDGNFNSEGHILHQESYTFTNNKYTVGDKVKFYVWGDNKTGLEQKVSFNVLDMTEGGNPKTAPVVYRGDPENVNEGLNVPSGQKAHKVFEWTIPADLKDNLGKYSIYVTWSGYDGYPVDGIPDSWHNIGIFRVIEDKTAPTLNLIPDQTQYFTDENVQLWASVNDTPEAGTVRAGHVDISAASLDNVLIDMQNGSGFHAFSGAPISLPAYGAVTQGTFSDIGKNSKYYVIQGKVQDLSGNEAITSTPQIAIHINKEEAGKIADKIYDDFGIGPTTWWWPPDWKENWTLPYARGPPNSVFCNRVNYGIGSGKTGHNYNREGGLSNDDAVLLEGDLATPMDGDCVKPIERSTKNVFIDILTLYLQALDVAGKF